LGVGGQNKHNPMKNHKLLVLLLSLFLCSCGMEPNADTPQLKAWVMMNNIDSDVMDDLKNSFIRQILAEETIFQLRSDYCPVKLYGEEGTYMANPWRVLLEREASLHYCNLYEWDLDRTKIFSFNAPWFSWTTILSTYRPKTMEDAYRLVEVELGQSSNQGKNKEILYAYTFVNEEECKAVYEAVGRAYVDYIYADAEEYVSVKDWEFCDYATTQSCTGYYVTYEIDGYFYVLVRYVEEDEDTGFQIKQLYAGDSIVELEQEMQSDMYYAIY
jgi:hypothetical protein